MASFTERYHELTKYNPHTIDKLGPVHWDRQPPPFKAISAKEKIDLLEPLKAVIEALETGAQPQDSEPPLQTLARLLFFTLGLTARMGDSSGGEHFLRAAPSAGGLYPTEIYVAVRNQKDLPGGVGPPMPDGIYHYHSMKSALIPVWQGSFWGDLKHYFLGHPAVEASDLILLFTGLYGRSAWRYKERAYRRILLDTGHALGNLLEVCGYARRDYAVLGSFLDDGLEELLFLTAKEEFPLLGVAIAPPGRLPPVQGQHPSDAPAEAIKHLVAGEAMQVQQNSCERIRDAARLRVAVDGACGSPRGEDASDQGGYQPLQTILRRRSCRKFTSAPVTLEQTREVLAFAFGDPGPAAAEPRPWCLAPGRLQFHLVALSVDGLAAGVYRYNPAARELAPKRLGEFRSENYFMCLGQDLAAECAFALIHTADLAALAETYGDRGYRYACMDAGQIGERINLWAVHRGLGSSGIGGYYDDQANELLELPLSHGILYITLVGVPEAG